MKSGLCALVGKDDADCIIEKAKLLLSYLPLNNAEGTVTELGNDNINRLVDIAYTESGILRMIRLQRQWHISGAVSPGHALK